VLTCEFNKWRKGKKDISSLNHCCQEDHEFAHCISQSFEHLFHTWWYPHDYVKYGRDHSELYNWHPVHSLLHFQVQSGIIAERKIHYYIITEKKRPILVVSKKEKTHFLKKKKLFRWRYLYNCIQCIIPLCMFSLIQFDHMQKCKHHNHQELIL